MRAPPTHWQGGAGAEALVAVRLLEREVAGVGDHWKRDVARTAPFRDAEGTLGAGMAATSLPRVGDTQRFKGLRDIDVGHA